MIYAKNDAREYICLSANVFLAHAQTVQHRNIFYYIFFALQPVFFLIRGDLQDQVYMLLTPWFVIAARFHLPIYRLNL